MITENLSTLKIHKLTQAQYERELAAVRIDENALYLTPYEEVDLSGYATVEQIDGKSDIGHTHTVADISDLTVTATELNYVDGVTSNIQTQLDGKAESSHTHDDLLTKTTLFSGAPDGLGCIITSESIYNFDLVIFNFEKDDNLFDVVIYPSQYSDGNTIALPFFIATNSTIYQHLTVEIIGQNGQQLRSTYWTSDNPYTIKNVYGIKFG